MTDSNSREILDEAANADVFTPRERARMGLGEKVKKVAGRVGEWARIF